MINNYIRPLKTAYISSFPPRECGIATFTYDLVKAIDDSKLLMPSAIVAVNESGATYNYGSRVKYQIERNHIESYRDAAFWVNKSRNDVVNLQHEFGLFGGNWGEYILTFLRNLQKPVVTTLHTVLSNPRQDLRNIMKEIAQYSTSLVAINKLAKNILKNDYEIGEKIVVIPHGAPEILFTGTETVKTRLGLKGKTVLSTVGFLSRNKGIEYAINALPDIVKEFPQLIYLIIGETHPEVRKNEGERYRLRLMKMVENLGLEKHVRFSNRFLSKRELIAFLRATDIYIAPYVNKNQISSGTLVYALVAGKAIISTPFLHAQDLLSDERGLFCKFRDSPSIYKSISLLLENEVLRCEVGKNAYNYGRNFIWSNVGKRYVEHFYHLRPEHPFTIVK
jgi:glycosyltransferase involved in cell wall biosynthesis